VGAVESGCLVLVSSVSGMKVIKKRLCVVGSCVNDGVWHKHVGDERGIIYECGSGCGVRETHSFFERSTKRQMNNYALKSKNNIYLKKMLQKNYINLKVKSNI